MTPFVCKDSEGRNGICYAFDEIQEVNLSRQQEMEIFRTLLGQFLIVGYMIPGFSIGVVEVHEKLSRAVMYLSPP